MFPREREIELETDREKRLKQREGENDPAHPQMVKVKDTVAKTSKYVRMRVWLGRWLHKACKPCRKRERRLVESPLPHR